MITSFDTGYAGHVDMSNIGYAGTAVNDRSFSDEYLTTAFDKATAMAQNADRLGYDTFWMAEHHFQPEGYECIPNIMLLDVHLAHLTKRIKLGCAFNITPMWHPLRLAEDFAMADILTGGGWSSEWAGVTTPGKWRPLARHCWTNRPTETCSRSR